MQVCFAWHIPHKVRGNFPWQRDHTQTHTCVRNINTNNVVGISFAAWLLKPGCVWRLCNSITLFRLVLGKKPVPWETTSLRGAPVSRAPGAAVWAWERRLWRGWKAEDLRWMIWIQTGHLEEACFWERNRWATLGAPQTHWYTSLHPTKWDCGQTQTDYLTQTPQVLLQRIHSSFTPSHPPTILSVSLSFSFSFRIVIIVPFTLPVDWSLLSRATNQAGLRHLCKPSSQWQVSLRGRRLNNAGGTPRRLSLLLPVSFHVGPDFFLNKRSALSLNKSPTLLCLLACLFGH